MSPIFLQQINLLLMPLKKKQKKKEIRRVLYGFAGLFTRLILVGICGIFPPSIIDIVVAVFIPFFIINVC